MPDEALITAIENIMAQVIKLGGANEQTSIVPNLVVQDANPTGLDGFVIVSDGRDGDNITARKLGSVIYANNDSVNVLFVEGAEAIAYQQGSGSSNNGIWEIVPSTSTDIYYDKGDVGIGNAAPTTPLDVTGTVTITDDILHAGDPDTKMSFADDKISLDAGGLNMLALTETAQDLVEIGDVAGAGDVDVNFNNDQVFIRGSDGFVGIGTTAPDAPLHSSGAGVRAIFGDGTANAFIEFDGGVSSRDMRYQTNGVNRWLFRVDGTAEGGSNAGSNFTILRRTDGGGILGTPLTIIRSTGYVGINRAAPRAQLEIDQTAAAAAVPVLWIRQVDVSEPFAMYQGSAAAATLTQSIVAEADVTTATRQGFVKIEVQDDGNQVTDQAYFVPFYTLA